MGRRVLVGREMVMFTVFEGAVWRDFFWGSCGVQSFLEALVWLRSSEKEQKKKNESKRDVGKRGQDQFSLLPEFT